MNLLVPVDKLSRTVYLLNLPSISGDSALSINISELASWVYSLLVLFKGLLSLDDI